VRAALLGLALAAWVAAPASAQVTDEVVVTRAWACATQWDAERRAEDLDLGIEHPLDGGACQWMERGTRLSVLDGPHRIGEAVPTNEGWVWPPSAFGRGWRK
jgi:hypothetical protein